MSPQTQNAALKEAFLQELSARLKTFGFSKRFRSQDFLRSFSGGKSVIHVSFIPHRTDVDLIIDLAVRIDEIEDLVNRFDSKLSPKEKRQSMTVGVELGNVSRGHYKRWTLESSESIVPVTESTIEAIREIAFPFFDELTNVRAIRKALAHVERGTLLAPIMGPRFMRLAAATYLDPDKREKENFADRVSFLEASDDLYAIDFRVMIEQLNERITNK